jgi:hypothetical protein
MGEHPKINILTGNIVVIIAAADKLLAAFLLSVLKRE